MHSKFIAGMAMAGALALALPAFAQTTGGTTTHTTSAAATKIACVGAAVNARETAIDSAMTTFTAALNAAYSARATALQQAYTGTNVKAAVKVAWSTFNASVKTARAAWRSARDAAWKTYRTAAVACKAPAGTDDRAHSGSESSGS